MFCAAFGAPPFGVVYLRNLGVLYAFGDPLLTQYNYEIWPLAVETPMPDKTKADEIGRFCCC